MRCLQCQTHFNTSWGVYSFQRYVFVLLLSYPTKPQQKNEWTSWRRQNSLRSVPHLFTTCRKKPRAERCQKKNVCEKTPVQSSLEQQIQEVGVLDLGFHLRTKFSTTSKRTAIVSEASALPSPSDPKGSKYPASRPSRSSLSCGRRRRRRPLRCKNLAGLLVPNPSFGRRRKQFKTA